MSVTFVNEDVESVKAGSYVVKGRSAGNMPYYFGSFLGPQNAKSLTTEKFIEFGYGCGFAG